MNLARIASMLVLFAAAAAAPCAASPAAKEQPDERQTGALSVEQTLSAIVHVRMKGIAGALSNESLGGTREGTGVVIDDKNHILTIGYIVMEADSIEVTAHDNRTVPATVTAYDPESGFALLHANLSLAATPIKLGSAADLGETEPVMVLPSGGRANASIAYVVSKRPFTGSWEYSLDSAIFTSPPTLNWAGAALVNHDGELVGIGSLLVRDTLGVGAALPGNMFVPVDAVKAVLADLIQNGKRKGAVRPWIGLATEEVQGRLFVTRVSRGGPAERAGIKAGDILLAVAGNAVKTHQDFYAKLWGLGPAGVEVALTVLQGAELRNLTLRSVDRVQQFKTKPTY